MKGEVVDNADAAKVEINVKELPPAKTVNKTEAVDNNEIGDLPIKSEVTSRVQVEQEIERLFGGGNSSFALNITNEADN